MKDLLTFLIKNLTGSEDFTVEENEIEDSRIELNVNADPDIIGLIIGKGGKTIKNLRKIVSVNAVLADKAVTINVDEKSS